jgi:alpha-mannosidase
MQDYKLYKNSDEIEVDVKLDWQEKHKQLKLVFGANVESPRALYEIPYGYIEKPCNGEEEPGLTWASIQGKNLGNTCGLTLMNDAKYSYCMLDNELQVLVARSPIYADHGGIRNKDLEYDYLDQGLQTFTYAIKANHGALNKSQIIKRSMEINTVFETVAESYHGGALKQRAGYIHVDRPNIILTVLKRSEEDDGYILRGYETDGVETDVVVALLLWDKKITLKFAPFEIKTIKICDSGKIEETDLLEM